MTITRAIGYVRVSTDEQATSGVSLAAQEAKIRAYAALYDIELISVEVDAGASAKNLNRPGLQRALSALRSGKADALLIAKLDRLTRSVRDLGALLDDVFKSERRSLLSVADQIDTRSAAGRLVLNLLTSVAAWERETGSERTSQALQHKASRGEFTGGRAPFGYRVADDGVSLVEVADEQALITEVRACRDAGMSLRAITALLAERGRTSRVGRPFATTQIARMLAC